MNAQPNILDPDGFRKMIRESIVRMGCTQKEFANRYDISETYLSDILGGRREPGNKLLKAIGMKRIVNYEWN